MASKVAITQLIGILASMPFAPREIEMMTVAWTMVIDRHRVTDPEIRSFISHVVDSEEAYPAPSKLARFVEATREAVERDRIRALMDRSVVVPDQLGNLTLVQPEDVGPDGIYQRDEALAIEPSAFDDRLKALDAKSPCDDSDGGV